MKVNTWTIDQKKIEVGICLIFLAKTQSLKRPFANTCLAKGFGTERMSLAFQVNRISFCRSIKQLSLSTAVSGMGIKAVSGLYGQRQTQNSGMQSFSITLNEIKEIIKSWKNLAGVYSLYGNAKSVMETP